MSIILIAHCVDFIQELLEYFLKREGLRVVICNRVDEIRLLDLEKNTFYIVRQIDSGDSCDVKKLKELRTENPSLCTVFGLFVNDASDELEKYFDQCGTERVYRYPCDWVETIQEIKYLTKQNAMNK